MNSAAAQNIPSVPAGKPADRSAPYTPADFLFSILFLFVGWSYWHILFGSADAFLIGNLNLGVPLFTVIFTAVSLAYMLFSRIRPTAESWFWLAVTLLLGTGAAHTPASSILNDFLMAALHFSAVYWVLCATGRLLGRGRTSDWILFDLVNLIFIIPWVNFGRQITSFFGWISQKVRARRTAGKQKAGKKKSRVLPVLAGILAACLCLLIVMPLLFHADRRFEALFSDSFGLFSAWINRLFWGEHGLFARFSPFEAVISLLVSLWLFGLVHGCIKARHTDIIRTEPLRKAGKQLRVAPNVTLAVILFALSLIYLLFIGFQASYLFGAFAGKLPAGFSHAEYARNGFFELCAIAAVNLAVLAAVNLISRKQHRENKLLTGGNIIVSALTLLLLVTAASKMGLYMQAYGLTVKRLLVMVFLVWIAAVFICILVLQFRPLPLTRIAAFLGAVLFTVFCLFPIDSLTQKYNLRYGHINQEVSSVSGEIHRSF